MDADDPQSGHADFEHVIRRVEENVKNPAGAEMENQRSRRHNGQRVEAAELDGVSDPAAVARTEIIADNRNHAAVQPENGHKDEALELKIDAENRNRGLRKENQNFVHSEGHD